MERAVLQKPWHQLFELVPAFEHNVGGLLGLGRAPVVAHGRETIFQKRVDRAGVAVEPRDTVQADEPVGESLGPTEVFEPQESVVLLGDRTP